jgi:acyl-CoA synthetase (AMP-forming)/AMP-acid ligase II
MDDCRTFIEVLSRRVARHPDRPAFIFLGGEQETVWSFALLERRARAVAAFLQERAAPGDRVLLCYPPGVEFLAGFFGCLFAGVTAVPIYPPRLNRSIDRLLGVLADARPRLVLTTTEMLRQVRSVFAEAGWLRDPPWLTSDDLPAGIEEGWREPAVGGDTVAFLQYTSGSTRAPRGVIVTQANLLANQRHIRDCFGHHEDMPPVVSWLPVYHDMGLVGNVLHPVYMGSPLVQLSPLTVLQRPVRWLEAISRFAAHTSGAPNFAYDLCVQRIRPEQIEAQALDLRSWRVAYVGAEPVRSSTLDAFAERFEPCGFRRFSFLPCYGLAEATLFVTGQRDPTVLVVSDADLEQGKARPADAEAGVRLVGSGPPPGDVDLLVVSQDSGLPLPDGQVGEIWARGPQVARGYWNNPEATGATFGVYLADGSGPFLRTGDLGFLRDGQLFVTGRIKDLIILDGRNLYPQDIEQTVQASHPALRPNAGAAFAIEGQDAERLVIVQEVERSWLSEDPAPICASIRRTVAEQHDVSIHDLVLVRPNSVPKTSSGKIQRSLCRDLYLRGGLQPAPLAPATTASAV